MATENQILRFGTALGACAVVLLLALSKNVSAQYVEPGGISLPPPIPEPSAINPLARRIYKLGKEFYWLEDYDLAIEHFTKAVDISPNWGVAQLYLGMSLAHKASYQESEVALLHALDDKELSAYDRAWAHRVIGNIASNNQRLKEAEANYKESLKYDPNEPAIYNALAYLYSNMESNLDEALRFSNKSLTKVRQLQNTLHIGMYLDTRGWIHYRMGNYKLAERDLTEALEIVNTLGPLSAHLTLELSDQYYHLGEVYRMQEKTSLAKEHLTKALELNSNNTAAEIALRGLK